MTGKISFNFVLYFILGNINCIYKIIIDIPYIVMHITFRSNIMLLFN